MKCSKSFFTASVADVKIQARGVPSRSRWKTSATDSGVRCICKRLREGLDPPDRRRRIVVRTAFVGPAPAGDALGQQQRARRQHCSSVSARAAWRSSTTVSSRRTRCTVSSAAWNGALGGSCLTLMRCTSGPSASRRSRVAFSSGEIASHPGHRVAGVRVTLGEHVAGELHQLGGGHDLAEEQGRRLGQLVRFVEDHRVGRRQQVGDAFVAQHEVGEEQVVIDDHDIGFLRRAARLHHEALAVVPAFHAEAVVARRRDEIPDRRLLRHFGELGPVAAAARLREPHDGPQVDRVLPRRQPAVLLRALQVLVADVVRPALQQRDGDRRLQRPADHRHVLAEQLVLQRLRAGRHDHLAAPQQRGHEIREGLAGAGARLGDQRAAPVDRIGHRLRHLDLSVAGAIAVHVGRQGAVRGEDLRERAVPVGCGGSQVEVGSWRGRDGTRGGSPRPLRPGCRGRAGSATGGSGP